MNILRGVLAALVVSGLGAIPAAADEAKIPGERLDDAQYPVGADAGARDRAYDRAITDPGPRLAPTSRSCSPTAACATASMSVTIKNPCPPGTAHYEPPRPRPPLPRTTSRRALDKN